MAGLLAFPYFGGLFVFGFIEAPWWVVLIAAVGGTGLYCAVNQAAMRQRFGAAPPLGMVAEFLAVAYFGQIVLGAIAYGIGLAASAAFS